ncbi:MAG: hypothetical protein IPQ05_18740 [Leptospiraceae bacterium]|nr:hypothetical protein [Leptospiraceae bacterium]
MQRQPDLSSLMQGQQNSIRRTNDQSQNPMQPQISNLPIDPITGKINPEAIARQREKDRINKEKKRQFLNRDIEPYVETRGRRMEIIFLTTFPFAAALSVGITILVGRASGDVNFLKTTQGFAFAVLCAGGFSAANMISDINTYDEYMKNKKENNANLPPQTKSQFIKPTTNFNFSFIVGSKSFMHLQSELVTATFKVIYRPPPKPLSTNFTFSETLIILRR